MNFSFPSLVRKIDGAVMPFEKAGVTDQIAVLKNDLVAAGYGPQLEALTAKHGVGNSLIASAVFIGIVWGAKAAGRTPLASAASVASPAVKVAHDVPEAKPTQPAAKGDTLRVVGQFAQFKHASEDFSANDLKPPIASDPDERFQTHYRALVAHGRSAEAGRFFQKHREKIIS